MSKYIDADKLIDNLNDLPEQERIALMGIYDVIAKCATTDVQEVKRGIIMSKEDISFEEAREYLLANYFDGDDDVRAFIGGDEESVVMAKAIEALTICIDLNKSNSQCPQNVPSDTEPKNIKKTKTKFQVRGK